MVAMASERDVTCPSCGASRSTKAARSTRVACFGCGELFAAPAPRSGPASDGGEPAGPGIPPGGPPAAADGLIVERADGVKIAQVSKPRARKKPAAGPPKEPLVGRHELATPDEHPAKAQGRRGGRAVYGGVVHRGRRR